MPDNDFNKKYNKEKKDFKLPPIKEEKKLRPSEIMFGKKTKEELKELK